MLEMFSLIPDFPPFHPQESLYLTKPSLSGTGQLGSRNVSISRKHQEMGIDSVAILQPISQCCLHDSILIISVLEKIN